MPTELPAGVGLIVGDDASGVVAQILQVIHATRDRALLATLRTQHARLQAQFDQLATTAMDALCSLNLSGAFVEASPACERIWGYTQADLLQKNFFEQTLAEDRAQVRAAAQAVRSGAETIRFSCRQHDRSGKVLLLICSFSWSAQQQCLLCTVRDETDRASNASELDVSQQHYQSLFDQNPDAVYSFDRNGNFVSVNHGAEQLCGYSRDELIGTALLPMIAPEYADQTNVQFRHALAGQGVTYQTVLLRKDGQRVHLSVTNLPIVVNDSVVGVFGIAKNITDQIHAFELKRQSEERFSNVARATTDTIWDWDLQADLLWWNDGLQNVFGYPVAEIEPDGSSWVSRIHPEDVAAVTHGIHAVIDGTGSSWTDQYRFRRFDGSYAWVVDRGFVIRDEHGKAIRMVGGMSDVSERKQSEMMLERLNRALRMLSACNQVLIRASSEQALLNQVCRIAREFGGYRVAWVGYVQNDASSSIKPVAQAGIAAATLEQIEISWSAQTPAGRGPSGRAVRSGQPEVLERATNDPSFADWADYAPLFGGGSVISLPLRTGGETIGVLTLHLTDTRAVPAEEMALLGELADNLGYGIETRRVDDERRRLLSTVEKVATAVSANSHQSAQQFFEQLVRNMADAVGAQAALVTRFSTASCDHVDTIAAVIDGATYPNFSYHIAGTACAQLIENGECVERELISELAPGEAGRALGEMRAYVGRRLDNSNGSPIGTIFVMFRDRLERVEHTLSALRIFAARVSAELERHAADQRIRDQAALLDHATDAIVVRSMDGSVTFWNKGAERLYGWTREEALGQRMLTRTAAESHDMQDILGNTVRDGEWRGELMQRRIDGQAVAVEARWTLIRDDAGAPQSILAIETDITQRKSAEHEIEHLAFYDRLTDLPNRLLLRNRLQHALETNERSGRMGALLCIDLDNFKALNDSLGHDTGDLLLQLVAVRLSYCLRASDTVARLGGDEFIILLVDLGDFATEAASRAKMVAEKILQAFVEPFSLAQQEGHTTPSIGITLFGNGQDTIDELLQRAELAMYQA
ncbi:MAG: PAS domain S-box protein, partial [Pseudomonadota bacterium]|nr:PAS domain S-box protein [Pseudomonadota bacterium]